MKIFSESNHAWEKQNHNKTAPGKKSRSKKQVEAGDRGDEDDNEQVEITLPPTDPPPHKPRTYKKTPAPVPPIVPKSTQQSTEVPPKKTKPQAVNSVTPLTLTPKALMRDSRPASFVGVLINSPSKPQTQSSGAIAELQPPHPGRSKRSADLDSEAAQVANELHNAQSEPEEGDFSPGQFEEPPDSDEERRQLLGPKESQTTSETEADGGATNTLFAEALGHALRPTNAPSVANSDTSFDDSTSDEFLGGIDEALMEEDDEEERKGLEEARGKGLDSKRAKARQLAKEQADWRKSEKGKGKEIDDGLPKAQVSKLSKSQVQ